MSVETVLIGAGGFGREALDVVEAHNSVVSNEDRNNSTCRIEIIGVIDDAPSRENLARTKFRGYDFLGTLNQLLKDYAPRHYLLGIGDPAVKREISALLDAASWKALNLIHPSASIGSHTNLGEGVIVCGGVQVSTNISLGRHVHLNPNATIGHDSMLGDFTSVNPAGVVSGDVSIGPETLVGAGAVVLQALSVGRGATIGAGACVVSDVREGDTVIGVPARILE